MKTVGATDAKNRLGAILDEAQREPIVIRRQDRDIAVVLSMADYERLRTGNIQAFLELRKQIAAEAASNGLTEEGLNELLGDGTSTPMFKFPVQRTVRVSIGHVGDHHAAEGARR
jgi:prevent-host-death family protein